MSAPIFCISMQRSGTTSVGDWLQAHGLPRAGWPVSNRNQWTRQWMNGDFEGIFASEDFRKTTVFEDDPWWCPEFYRYLAHRFPEARFVLLERDPASWFQSLCAHSAGRNPGYTDLHCKIYRREDDLARLRAQGADVTAWNLLDVTAHSAHYQAIYSRHGEEVRAFFAQAPERLFHGQLDDPGVFDRLRSFLGLPADPTLHIPHANASSPGMIDALRQYRAASAACPAGPATP